jgi:hypothetical protein
MLGRTSYPKPYVNAVRARVARVLKAYDKAKPAEPFAAEALLDIVLGLEMAFVHRVRMNEGKDGNVLNEVRMLAASILEFDGVMTLDKTIKWNASRSVTGLEIGDKIALSRKQLGALAEAFFDEIEAKYHG